MNRASTLTPLRSDFEPFFFFFAEPPRTRTFRLETRRSLSPSSYRMSNVPSEFTREILPLNHFPLPL